MLTNIDKSKQELSLAALDLLGGRLCLDFINTMDPRIGEQPREFLLSYANLVAWSQYVGVLTQEQGNALLGVAQLHVEDANETFQQAITLREALYRIFTALIAEEEPQRVDREIVRNMFAQAMAHAQFVQTEQGFEWQWGGRERKLDGMLWPIVSSAIDILTSGEWRRVKQCPGVGDCGWLFLDTSKNGSRQWCSMQECGSRAKMRRQYARKRVKHLLPVGESMEGF